MDVDEILAWDARRAARNESFEGRVREWCAKNERRIEAKAVDGTLELAMLDVVGTDWWTGGGITEKWVQTQLDANKGVKNIKVLMNSPGGDAFVGLSIYNLLKRNGAQIEVEVVGMAASAASVIMMAGDQIIMHAGAMAMIHEAWTVAGGNSKDMRAAADFLAKLDAGMLDIYAQRTGRNRDELALLVEAETWFSAAEAVEAGFATSVIAAKTPATQNKGNAQVGWHPLARFAPEASRPVEVKPLTGLSRLMN